MTYIASAPCNGTLGCSADSVVITADICSITQKDLLWVVSIVPDGDWIIWARVQTDLQRFGPFAELRDQLHLGGSTSCNEELLVHQAPDNTQGIMKTSLCLLQHQLVAASQQAGGCAALAVDACHLHHLALANLQRT